jgi:mono/diheme cytochrome c family protein
MVHEMVVPRRPPKFSTWLLAIGLASVSSREIGAQHAPDAAAGRQMAERWCSSCHVVGPTQQGGTSRGAPPFAAVANMPSTTAMALRVFLMTPHGRMPDLRLSHDEIDDIAAYILSLRR